MAVGSHGVLLLLPGEKVHEGMYSYLCLWLLFVRFLTLFVLLWYSLETLNTNNFGLFTYFSNAVSLILQNRVAIFLYNSIAVSVISE